VTACVHPSPNHSTDVAEVWHGRPDPTYICGYHLQSVGLNRTLQAAADHGPGCDGPLNCTCEPAWDGAK
jgi:hypothetical protein